MNNPNNHGTIEISKALIGCFGAVMAAIIGGFFLLVSVGTIQIGSPSPSAQPVEGQNPVVPEPTRTSQAALPVFPMQIIVVPGDLEEGEIFECRFTGSYKITVEQGAYSPWVTDDIAPDGKAWFTSLQIYKNRSAEWVQTPDGLLTPQNQDYDIGVWEHVATQVEAEANGMGKSKEIDCKAGDYLLFVPIDEKGVAYNDNRGEVVLQISLVSP